jgi:hypothetical protein
MIPVWWQKFRASRNGKIDGAKGHPSDDQPEVSFYEQHLRSSALLHIRKTSMDWIDEDRKLKQDFCESNKVLENLKERINELKEDQTETEGDRKVWLDSHDRIHSVSAGYWVLLVFLAISEFPMNSVVFDLMGEVKWLTYLLAAGLGVTIPVCAHLLGINLRRLKDPDCKNPIMTLVILLSMLLTIFCVAYLREKYVIGTIEILKIDFDPRMVTIVFVSINLLIFTVATVASYMAHIDVSDDQAKTKQQTERVLGECAKILKEHSANIEKLSAEKNKIEELIEKLEVKREKTLEKYKHEAESWANHFEWLMDIYRISNMRARKPGSKPPVCFSSKPTIELGILDEELDKNC